MASNIDWRNEIAARAKAAGLHAFLKRPSRNWPSTSTRSTPPHSATDRTTQRRGDGLARRSTSHDSTCCLPDRCAGPFRRRPVRRGAGHRSESESARRDSSRRASASPASGIRRHHHPRARARHRRQHHRVHRRRFRAAAAAAVRGAGPARHAVGLESEPRVCGTSRSRRSRSWTTARSRSSKSAAAWWRPSVNLVDPGLDPIRVNTIEVSGNLFDVLGVRPQIGQGFPVGGPFFVFNEPLVVISDRLWRSRYDADRVDRRASASLQRRAAHRRRRHAAAVPLPGRRGRMAAAAVGPDSSFPIRALHGVGAAAEEGHDVRAGARRRGHASRTTRQRVPAEQRPLGADD